LFNWLFARHHGGRFLLRIEDTDRARSTDAAVEAIFDGIRWLGLDWDGEAVMQFARADRHAEVARKLLAEGKAYLCYCTPDELTALREEQRAKGLPMRYPGIWRDRDPSEAPAGAPAVVRLKAPNTGETIIADLVQGEVRVANEQLDDMVLLRADGTPTYMLSVVVDDHDMGITHVIRGDDHLTNAFRQYQLYKACGWDVPVFAHIPLIHGADGAKLSKRHGALGVDAYRDMGFLPEAMRNYLLRLGWGHGDDEIISTEQAIQWFDLDGVGRSPSRFDFVKLTTLNGHYMRQADNARLTALLLPLLEAKVGRAITDSEAARVEAGMTGLKDRAKTMVELVESALFYVLPRPLALDDKAAKQMADQTAKDDLAAFADAIGGCATWNRAALEEVARALAEARGQKLGKIAQPLRAALTGSSVSPPIFEVMEVLGRDEALGRIIDITG
jgi:glutamyl-tRNA synthetase